MVCTVLITNHVSKADLILSKLNKNHVRILGNYSDSFSVRLALRTLGHVGVHEWAFAGLSFLFFFS